MLRASPFQGLAVASLAVPSFVLLLLAGCQGPAAATLPLAESFDTTADGQLPAGWHAAETNGRGHPATWVVDASGSGSGIVRVAETRNAEDTFNLLLSEAEFPADLTLTVRVRADSGREDQGGGLLWRAHGPADYYVARWNPLENNLRAYHVLGSRRTMIASADVFAEADTWHTLRVSTTGARIEVTFDGKAVLDFEDTALAGAGRVGLWTKADAATSFDDLEVEAR